MAIFITITILTTYLFVFGEKENKPKTDKVIEQMKEYTGCYLIDF